MMLCTVLFILRKLPLGVIWNKEWMAVNAVIVLIFLLEKEHCFTQFFAVEHD